MRDEPRISDIGEKELVRLLTAQIATTPDQIDGLGHDAAFFRLKLQDGEIIAVNTDRSGKNVAENLGLAGLTAPGKWPIARIYDMCPRLKERRTSRGTDLSGGEQQMLAIARALIRDPKIVLLDEPFEGLAPIIVRELVNVCRDLAAAGQTIVLVEQNIAATLALAQRVYMINNGHIVHESPAQEVRERPEILRRYLSV